MAKVDIELVKVVLQRAELDAHKTAQIIEDLVFEARAYKGAGWVAQIPEDDEPDGAEEKLYAAARDFNLTPKGRRMPLTTVAEACEFGSAKINKEHGLWIRSKEPVPVVPVFNKIPAEEI